PGRGSPPAGGPRAPAARVEGRGARARLPRLRVQWMRCVCPHWEVTVAEAGIGVDIVEIARMERIIRDTPGFFPRMFTEEERHYCESSARPAAHYACRFAAREAVLKSLGVGFGQEGVGRRDVAVSRDSSGRPIAVLSGGALEVAKRLGVQEVALSLSFTGDLAVANAMAITAEARPKPKPERVSERERIAQSFKEARAVLDELERVQESELLEIAGEAPVVEKDDVA
ncbi:MAG: holo-ACP synthase, partial [Collinsella stercoris]|nr:holo-ACP synthase [Collinsella stercoris]